MAKRALELILATVWENRGPERGEGRLFMIIKGMLFADTVGM